MVKMLKKQFAKQLKKQRIIRFNNMLKCLRQSDNNKT